ncbi:hypothetical protein NDU88_007843 [Pleurodeles waltl]|uniref:Uncharacterized protein n=1 Tax=Pleurodeles waltl TaxID=8319 RepID=A0AAV7RTI2_PLEWA|nr:hypothetical protein NDU88_007843 [Pleurodeles waltl]
MCHQGWCLSAGFTSPATKGDIQSLLQEMRKDIAAINENFKKGLRELDNLVKGVENCRDTVEATGAQHDQVQDDIVERVSALEPQQQELSDPLEDNQNRSCRNYNQITGISATISNAKLEGHVQALFRHILQDLMDTDFTVDHTHSLFSSYQQ